MMHRTERPVFILFFLCAILPARPRIAVTEVLKDPPGLETAIPGGASHEFIEFVNLDGDSFSIDSLFLSDGSTVNRVIPWITPLEAHPNCRYNRTRIAPGGFCLILDRDYAKSPAGSFFEIADSAVILTVDASSLVNGLAEARGFFLYSGTAAAIHDSLASCLDNGYPALLGGKAVQTPPDGIGEGFSIVPSGLLFPAAFIANPDTLSPGSYEFIHNGWLCEYRLHDPGAASSAVICTIGVYKPGTAVAHAQWSVKASGVEKPLGAGEVPPGAGPYFTAVSLPKDSARYACTIEENGSSLTIPIDISGIWLPRSPVKINEVFPRAADAVPEWFELVNLSSIPVNLKNWRYGTPESADQTLTRTDRVLLPGHLCVVTRSAADFSAAYPYGVMILQPAAWQSLDNYRDTLFLFNPLDPLPCDTACYDNDWFDSWQNQSVTRVSTASGGLARKTWTLSRTPSPGLPNTAAVAQTAEVASLDIGPIPFTPDGDGKNDSLSIRVFAPADRQVSITIYGFDGTIIRQWHGADNRTVTWNGRTVNGKHAPAGPFFVVAAIRGADRQKQIRAKGILWR
jgi:hypothetical protein